MNPLPRSWSDTVDLIAFRPGFQNNYAMTWEARQAQLAAEETAKKEAGHSDCACHGECGDCKKRTRRKILIVVAIAAVVGIGVWIFTAKKGIKLV